MLNEAGRFCRCIVGRTVSIVDQSLDKFISFCSMRALFGTQADEGSDDKRHLHRALGTTRG